MANYIASNNASKKRRQVWDKEVELAHVIRHGSDAIHVEKAAEKLRHAHLSLLKAIDANYVGNEVIGRREENLETESEFWNSATVDEIIEHFRKHADPTLLERSVTLAACRTPEFLETPPSALSWLETAARHAIAGGARLILFPECFLQGYLTEESAARRAALDLTSPEFTVVLQRLAALPIMLVFGLIEIEGNALYNTAVIVKKGHLLGRYRKTNIHDGESIFTAGTEFPVFELDGIKFGINICYDTRFPGATAAVAAQGAELLLCPSNNMLPRARAEAWKDRHHQIRAERARETGLYILSADVAGDHEDRVSYGPVSLIAPSGEEISYMPYRNTGPMIVTVKLASARLSSGS